MSTYIDREFDLEFEEHVYKVETGGGVGQAHVHSDI